MLRQADVGLVAHGNIDSNSCASKLVNISVSICIIPSTALDAEDPLDVVSSSWIASGFRVQD